MQHIHLPPILGALLQDKITVCTHNFPPFLSLLHYYVAVLSSVWPAMHEKLLLRNYQLEAYFTGFITKFCLPTNVYTLESCCRRQLTCWVSFTAGPDTECYIYKKCHPWTLFQYIHSSD